MNNTATHLPQLAQLQHFLGTADVGGLLLIAVAAVATALVMATTPKPLRILSFLYFAAMAGCLYLHADKAVEGLIPVGLIASVIFYPFRPKAKNA